MNYILCNKVIPDKIFSKIRMELDAKDRDLIYFPEIECGNNTYCLNPKDQINKVKSIIVEHAKTKKPFILMTNSPFVLKAVEVQSDLLECSEDIECIGNDGNTTTIQELFKPMSEAMSILMKGEHST